MARPWRNDARRYGVISIALHWAAPLGTGPLWRFARLTHVVLLVLIAAQLVTGPVDVWSGGWPIGVFDWFEAPSPFGTLLKTWHDPIGDVHRYTGYAIAGLP